MAKKEIKQEISQDMTLEESKAYRASLAKAVKKSLSANEKREAFRAYWAQKKKNFKKHKNLEDVLWLHLKAIKMDEPENFDSGLAHFGLAKIK